VIRPGVCGAGTKRCIADQLFEQFEAEVGLLSIPLDQGEEVVDVVAIALYTAD